MTAKIFNIERLIHSIKTTIACMIGFIAAKLINLPSDQWILITIMVVMCSQLYVGSVLQKSYWRFLGTLIGCIFASITILLFAPTNLAIAGVICLSSFVFSYFATLSENLSYACTLGAVTTIIIMMGYNHEPSLRYAAERLMEICIGLLIAGVVSQFILPINARAHLRRAQANTLKLLRQLYLAAMDPNTKTKNVTYQDMDEEIVASILKQRQLAKQSKREPLGLAFNSKRFLQTLLCEKQILRAINFMQEAATQDTHIREKFLQSSSLQKFNREIESALDALTQILQLPEPVKKNITVFIPSLDTLRTDLRKDMPTNDIVYIDSFLFMVEILVKNLMLLAELYGVRERIN